MEIAKGKRIDSNISSMNDLSQRKVDELEIPLNLIDAFPDHPYKVQDDEDMERLVESIKVRGVITPALVRKKEDGRYELISGHRRKHASETAGLKTLRCEVAELTRDEAIILMVESNYQRAQQLPSERAFAYKMRLEALARQGKRTDLTCATELHRLDGTKSRDAVSDKSGETVRRYVRLTRLVPELLEMVDNSVIREKDSLQMALKPAVELSHLDEQCQRMVVEEINLNDCTPSHDQTIRMRKLYEEGKLTPEAIQAIISEQKPNQREKIVLHGERVRQLIPKNLPFSQREEYICKALEHYAAYVRRRAERETR